MACSTGNFTFTFTIGLKAPKQGNYENLEEFHINSDVNISNTQLTYNLHLPNCNLTKYWQTVYYTHIKLLNNLHTTIKNLNHDIEVLKPALKHYLLCHSLYPADEITSTENSWTI